MTDFPGESVNTIGSETSLDSLERQMSDDDEIDVPRNTKTDNNVKDSAAIPSKSKYCLSYTELINDMIKPRPNPAYGHFESFAYAQYCKDCRIVVQPKFASQIPCKSPELVVKQDGTVICVHARCERLDLTEYIRAVASECGSWKKTYWRAWSECHFLSCVTCKWRYPVRNSTMCQYHSERPEYFPIGNLGLEQPIGRFPCCGERAFRYQSVRNPFGCKFRMHNPNIQNVMDAKIQSTMRKHFKLTTVEPPSLNYEKTIMKLVDSDPGLINTKNRHWWLKLSLGQSRWTYQPMVSLIWNLINNEKKHKKSRDSKRKKKNTPELQKQSFLSTAHTKLKCSSNHKKCKEKCLTPKTSIDAIDVSKHSLNKYHSLKVLLPIISIQDMQRERENMIFNQIYSNKSTKRESSYAVLHSSMISKIVSQNKTKTNKTTLDKKKKYS